MNKEQHIIKFEYNIDLYRKIVRKNDFYMHQCNSSKNRQSFVNIDILYLNLHIYNFISLNYYDYIFNLSNMLYKLHNPNYYRKYNCKELI